VRVRTKNRRFLNSRQTRLPSEKRFEDLRHVVAGGDEQREDRTGRRSDEQSDLARPRIDARTESTREREAARLERAADAEVPEDRFDFAARGAERDAAEIGCPINGRHGPLYDALADDLPS